MSAKNKTALIPEKKQKKVKRTKTAADYARDLAGYSRRTFPERFRGE